MQTNTRENFSESYDYNNNDNDKTFRIAQWLDCHKPLTFR